MRSAWRRRAVLHGVVGLAAGLAGCFSDSNGDGESPDSNEFDDVRVEGTMLIVELAAGAAIDRVNVIAPDGTAFAGKDVQQGVTTVEFDIGVAYQAGEHRIVGVADGQTVAETTLDITPNVTITEVGVGANHLDRMPENLNFRKQQSFVTVANQGNGPELIKKLLILGDVPNPTTELQQSDEGDATGIFDVEDGFGELQQPIVPAGKTVTFYSTTKPFLFTGDGIQCKSERQTGTGRFELPVKIGDVPVTNQYQIEYSASDKSDECSITITEEVS